MRALEERGFGRAAASPAAERLEQEGWLDDLGAARSAARAKGVRYGRSRVERELSARGFDPETIAAALAAELPEREGPALQRAFERLWARHGALPLRERRRKVTAALSRRGFAPADISAMMRSFHEVR